MCLLKTICIFHGFVAYCLSACSSFFRWLDGNHNLSNYEKIAGIHFPCFALNLQALCAAPRNFPLTWQWSRIRSEPNYAYKCSIYQPFKMNVLLTCFLRVVINLSSTCTVNSTNVSAILFQGFVTWSSLSLSSDPTILCVKPTDTCLALFVVLICSVDMSKFLLHCIQNLHIPQKVLKVAWKHRSSSSICFLPNASLFFELREFDSKPCNCSGISTS